MTLSLEKKYEYYESSVQNPVNEVKFMSRVFEKLRGRQALSLREDFGGTGYISCTWVKSQVNRTSVAVDLDPEPIQLGKNKHQSQLKENAQKRVKYLNGNVLSAKTVPVDVLCAFNFSYYIFKSRTLMLSYFKTVKKNLKKDGVFFLDLFGGPESQKILVEKRKIGKLTYYWDCQKFNPITHDCLFAIHFKDEKKMHRNVFTYEWRFWMLPELLDLLHEAGFKNAKCYWEGDGKNGDGNGIFKEASNADNCLAWVSYIVAYN
jgi:hypothetical protein